MKALAAESIEKWLSHPTQNRLSCFSLVCTAHLCVLCAFALKVFGFLPIGVHRYTSVVDNSFGYSVFFLS